MSKIALLLALSSITLGGCATGAAYAITGTSKTTDGSPVAGHDGFVGELNAKYTADYRRMSGSFGYFVLNTNYEFPPYETFWGDQLTRASGDIGKTFDRHIFNFDWNDTYSSSPYGR